MEPIEPVVVNAKPRNGIYHLHIGRSLNYVIRRGPEDEVLTCRQLPS
jgi:hypothetical protein|eukprot:COSAG02_NODE_862_length_16418_cov_5.730621_4_plen_47_part_00